MRHLDVLGVALLACATGTASAAVRIELLAHATVAPGAVSLDQVAVMSGGSPDDRQRLSNVPVTVMDRHETDRRLQALDIERIVRRTLAPHLPATRWSGAQAVTLKVQRRQPGDQPLAVRRLDRVELASTQGLATVTRPAQALAQGRPGDVIGARMNHGPILRALVLGDGQLALEGAE